MLILPPILVFMGDTQLRKKKTVKNKPAQWRFLRGAVRLVRQKKTESSVEMKNHWKDLTTFQRDSATRTMLVTTF